ncbi:MAG: hypothetical protein V4653_15395 [Pseudomonadota bacterium]
MAISETYSRLLGGLILRDDGVIIPPDPANLDYAAFLAWEVAGGIAEMEAPAAPAVPASISARQMLLGLAGMGMITEAEALAAATVGAVPEAIEFIFATLPAVEQFGARVTWARMSEVERAHPLVAMLGAAQGLSSKDLDAFFVTAAAL